MSKNDKAATNYLIGFHFGEKYFWKIFFFNGLEFYAIKHVLCDIILGVLYDTKNMIWIKPK